MAFPSLLSATRWDARQELFAKQYLPEIVLGAIPPPKQKKVDIKVGIHSALDESRTGAPPRLQCLSLRYGEAWRQRPDQTGGSPTW